MDKWTIYEQEKKKIAAQLLTNEEYEKAIAELVRRLGI